MPKATTKPEQNKMGVMPVKPLLITMSLPMILSMLVQAMYNIIDSIFVAQLGEKALTAVSMAFPIQNLMIAVSSGTCVGVNALLSRSLGEQNQDAAQKAAVNGIFLSVAGAACFALFGLLGSRLYFASQTNDPTIIEYGVKYLSICLIFSFGIFLEIVLERILQSTGRTIYNMYSQGAGAITNIILDPIMIFGLFGFPAMGISGAAIATVTGQILAMVLSLFFNVRKNTDVSINMRGFSPDLTTIRIIYEVGFPSIIMQSIGSVMTYFLNLILVTFTETAVTVLGVYFKLQSFIFMPIFGLNNGMIPIIAFNYGARNKKRIIETTKFSIFIAVSIMLTGLALFQVFTRQMLLLFNASPQMLEIGIPALRIISLSFSFAGYCIIVGSVFQALGNGVYSLLTSVARQLLCLLPLAYVFAKYWGLHAVWYSFPLAEIISVLMSTILFIRIYQKKIRNLQ
ncbi:MAG: MATE family efflux transporter [Lachnospiraceae bacterium]|nr:MATE family efflux transporter [Lachnospiraceae bacterium]MCI9183257.1 MATE family efflux transporter [Lachnospiraceae bacterium]